MGSGLDHLRQLYAPQRSWAGLKKVSGPVGGARLRRSAPAVACGVLVSTARPCPAAAPRPSTRRGRRDSQRSACASSGCRPVVNSKTTYPCRGYGPRVPCRRPAARQRTPSRASHITLGLLDRQSLGRPARGRELERAIKGIAPTPRSRPTCAVSSTPCSPNRTTARGRPVPDPRRPHDVQTLTTSELEQARRELQASLALARPCSPIRVPIEVLPVGLLAGLR